MVFLGLFTYFLLTDFYPVTPSVIEYIVWGWTITMALEELRQVISGVPDIISGKFTCILTHS